MVEETNEQCQHVQALIKQKQEELIQAEQEIRKLFDLYEDGTITKQRFSERIGVNEDAKKEIQAEVEKYRQMLALNANLVTVELVQKRIDEFKQLWTNATDPSEQNRAFRLLIDKIVYDREENGVTLEVLYK